jgi:GTP-binding protein HflX
VGYTNAGKSTLFNRLTDSGVYSADQLFATLDPTIRRLELGAGEQALIVDTVGFISNLPHELIDSFKSTLQETREVEEVLTQIGADVPQILVFNKIDALSATEREELLDAMLGEVCVSVSAQTGEGIERLLSVVAEFVRPRRRRGWLTLQPENARERAMLYDHDAVRHERIGDTGEYILQVEIAEQDWQRFIKRTGITAELVNSPH